MVDSITTINATELNCCECGGEAVAFWPIVDPDIPSWPYCRPCLDNAKQKFIIKLSLLESKKSHEKGGKKRV